MKSGVRESAGKVAEGEARIKVITSIRILMKFSLPGEMKCKKVKMKLTTKIITNTD